MTLLSGIVLVYDITRRDSFENLEMWIKEVKQYCTGGLERIRMILIGNKLDLEENRQVIMHREKPPDKGCSKDSTFVYALTLKEPLFRDHLS